MIGNKCDLDYPEFQKKDLFNKVEDLLEDILQDIDIFVDTFVKGTIIGKVSKNDMFGSKSMSLIGNMWLK